jgi:acetyl-CoA C-acetyltransferase
MREVVIVGAARTPFGTFGGGLKSFKAVELGGIAIKEAVNRAGIKPDQVEYLYYGQVVQAGCGQVPGRQAGLKAGLPVEVPSVTINKVCSSGIVTCGIAYKMIAAGFMDIAMGGGMESMSNIPFGLPDMRWGARMGIPNKNAVDLMVWDGLWCAIYNRHMAIHGSEVAREMGLDRVPQDHWACRSQNRAEAAIKAGKLKDEIVPVTVSGKKPVTVDTDESPRFGCTYEDLAKLPPVFDPNGSVTAGNAPGVNDGASALVLMSREKADELGLKPLATVLGYAEVSQEPRYIATVPGLSIQKLLKDKGMTNDDVDLFEINEAFAAVALTSGKAILGLNDDQMDAKVNVNGSAVAFGHPIGASGGRILMTAAYELKRRGGGIAACGICSGAAQGDAILIKVE